MPQRYDLDDANTERKGIDASWSPTKKVIISVICVGAATAVLLAGAFTLKMSSPPPMPTTAQEAMDVIGSKRFDRLSSDRRTQYLEESRRLFWEMSPEEREALRADENAREQMREVFEKGMDDLAKRIARGEEIDWSEFRRPRGERPPQGERERPTEEERAQRRAEFTERMNERMSEQLSSGNSQSGALRSEMMQRFMRGGGGRGGGRGGGGGGNRGGGGGGGRGGGGGGDA